jgi:8-oxo-dGTP pyrophosphatase MutT (NUDIX family)
MQQPWRTLSSRTAYANPWIRVREDEVTRPDGTPGTYGVVELRPAVFVVPVTEADEVVLVDLFRYTVGRWSLEVPAGGTDGEEPAVAARRELLEETGLVADEWREIGRVDALNGVAAAPEHVFLARGLHPADGERQAEEGIRAVRRVPWPQVVGMVADGTIRDGETVAALMLAAIALGRVA